MAKAKKTARRSQRKPASTPKKRSTTAKAKAKTSARRKKPSRAAARPRKAAARPKPAATGPSQKQILIDRLAREHETTKKVMRALPADQGAFQPHPRSHSAKRLLWTFVQEQMLGVGALTGSLQMPPDFGVEPESVDEIIDAYEAGVEEVIDLLASAPDADLERTVPFFTGPGQMGEVPVRDILWLMLNDSIHHRGQLSVYVRMAGGLVPSIYGPSADEPWM